MKIYIDLFLLFNIVMDMTIILAVGVLLKRKIKKVRIIIASLVGGISSMMLFANINLVFIEIVTAFCISLISFGYRNVRYTIKNVIYMYLMSVILGGIMYLFNLKVSSNIFLSYLIMLIVSGEVMVLYIKEMKKMREVYNNNYKVDIYFRDETSLSLVGFVDTGNNLYDPYKRRPIILISNKYYRDDKFILVPYSTIDKHGILKCIKIASIWIDGVKCNREVLAAFSDNMILIDGVDVILHRDIVKG